MRISEYLQIGDRLKTARMKAGINQNKMARKLSLSNSTYSNYENGYSEPPMEIILEFCNIIEMPIDQLFGFHVASPYARSVKTFADFIAIIIDLDRRGLSIEGKTTYSEKDNQLVAHLNLDMVNSQLATFIPNWNKTNQELKSGLMDEEEYNFWLEDTLKMFNVPIDEYLYEK